MRHLIIHTFVASLCLAPLAAHASPPAGEAKSEAKEGAGDKKAVSERILGALSLPLKAQALRKAGVGEPEVKAGLNAAKGKKLAAKDAAELLEEAAKATREHGPVDNFGAFVQEKLEAGLRGKELAEAIRSEHAARGKGKGKSEGKGEGKGPPEGKGPDEAKGPDDKGPPEGKGHEGAAGPDGEHGKPEDKGAEGKGPEGKGPEGKGPDEAKAGAPEDKGGKPEDKGGAPEDKGGKPEDKGGKPEGKGK